MLSVRAPTDLKLGPTMRTEEEAVPPVLLVMLDLVLLLVCDTLKHKTVQTWGWALSRCDGK